MALPGIPSTTPSTRHRRRSARNLSRAADLSGSDCASAYLFFVSLGRSCALTGSHFDLNRQTNRDQLRFCRRYQKQKNEAVGLVSLIFPSDLVEHSNPLNRYEVLRLHHILLVPQGVKRFAFWRFFCPPEDPLRVFANHNCSRRHISYYYFVNYAIFAEISGNIVIIAQITHIPDVFDSIYLSSLGCP